MHFVYGFCNGNARAAPEEYQRPFPDRRIPSTGVFTRIHQTMSETGYLPSVVMQSQREVVRTINTRENILEMVQRNPRLSTRRMASRIGVSLLQVWRTLHEEDLYPYHDQRYNNWNQANMLNVLICATDKASFTRDGINNSRNLRAWSHENPHETRISNFQRRFSVNAWCGVLGNRLSRPFVFDNNLTGNTDEAFLRNELLGC